MLGNVNPVAITGKFTVAMAALILGFGGVIPWAAAMGILIVVGTAFCLTLGVALVRKKTGQHFALTGEKGTIYYMVLFHQEPGKHEAKKG